jgi:Protein of unknown function (DUF3631)
MSAPFSINGNEAEIRKALGLLIEPGAVFEVRAPKNAKISNSWKTGTVSGYFDNIDSCIAELGKIESAEAVYVTLNPVNPALLARRKNRLDYSQGGDTTSDHDVTERRWLLIDCDPQRPQGISASNPEKERATAKARKIYTFLMKERGWPKPVACDSGNGNHLLFRVALPTDDSGLVKRVLEGLDHRFGGDGVRIDCSVFNAARITKLYGTPALKGDNTPERPHRLSKVLVNGSNGAIVTREQLEALANELAPPAPEQPVLAVSNGVFDVEAFFAKHAITTKHKSTLRDGRTMWILAECPFNADHGARTDTVAFQWPDGRLGFKCQHDSCQEKHWRDFRSHYEPERPRTRNAEKESVKAASAATEASKAPEEAPGLSAPMVTPRPLDQLLDAICGILRRYVVFSLDEQAIVIALWVIHTHLLEAFDYSPYLNVFSASKRSGKSRVLEVLNLLACNPRLTSSGSAAALIRSIDEKNPRTILLDEVDAVYSKKNDNEAESLRQFLNAGFRRGATFLRCVGQGTNLEPKEFPAFCPKALAGIDRCLPDTVADRCLPIELVRQSREEKAERFREREAKAVVANIRAELEALAQQPGLINALRQPRPDLPDELNDRQMDITEPLLSIADLAGKDWPEKARVALVNLCAQEEDASIEVKLLADIKSIYDARQADKLPTIDLLKALVGIEDDRPWALWWEDALTHDKPKGPAARMAKMLKRYKIKPCKIRFGEETANGYHRASFEKAWERYLSSPFPKDGTNGTDGTKSGFTRAPSCSDLNAETRNVPTSTSGDGTQSHEGKTKNVPSVLSVPSFLKGVKNTPETELVEVLRI